MSLERLDPRDRRLILACVAISALSIVVGLKYFFLAFPEASIEFRVTRESSAPVAKSFLNERELDPAEYRHAAIFDFDDEQKTFLERELGVSESNRLLETKVRLWRWKHRWYRPLQKEEMSVEVTTKGEVVGFEHVLAEEAPGADLGVEDARRIAETFLAGPMGSPLPKTFLAGSSGNPLATLTFIEASSQKRPHRTDHSFTWKVVGSEVKGADYRIKVNVAGAEVSGYAEFLKVPDTWIRDYAELRSKNEITGQVDAVLLVLTILAMVTFLVLRIRRGDVRWKAAWFLGGLIFVLLTLSQLNGLPGALYEYDTTSSFGAFLLARILGALGTGLGGGVLIFVLTAAAEPFYRERFPKLLSLTSLLRPRALRSKEFFVASLVGITLTFFFFAYENAFYIIANKLGAWAPRDVAYSELLSTAFPWVYVLFFGFLPALSEEFISRMFSIPFFERMLRSTALAVVISAFIWGFGHAGYPNQPFWIRGLEVGIAGIVFGVVMLRFGIASVVICHFSVDALYTAFVLIRSPNLYYRVSGALSAGIFGVLFLIAAVGYLRRGGFEPPEVTNEVEGIAPPPPPAPLREVSTGPAEAYRPLARRTIAFGLIGSAAVALLALVPVPSFGDWVSFRSDRTGAKSAATSFLKSAGFDVTHYRNVVELSDRTDRTAVAYLIEAGEPGKADRFYRDLAPTPLWLVRFYVPGQKEEFRVSVDANTGSVVGFARTLPEDAPGATIPKERALDNARRFLADRGIDPDRGELKDQSEKDEKARRDHTLVWEFTEPGAGEARVRHEVIVQGDSVGSWLREVKIPEEWRREYERQTFLTVALRLIKFPFLLGIAGFALVLFIAKVRGGEIPWKFAFVTGSITAVAGLVRTCVSLDTLWGAYDTSIPAAGYLVVILIGGFLGMVLFFVAGTLTGALAGALFPAAVAMLRAERRRVYARDALVAGVVALGLRIGVPALAKIIASAVPFGWSPAGVTWPTGVDSSVPSILVLMNAVSAALFVAALAGIVVGVLRRWFRTSAALGALTVFYLMSFLPASARGPGQFVVGVLVALIALAAIWVLVRVFLRDNPLAWLAAAFLGPGALTAAKVLAQPSSSFRVQGGIALAVFVLAAIALAVDAFRGARRTATP